MTTSKKVSKKVSPAKKSIVSKPNKQDIDSAITDAKRVTMVAAYSLEAGTPYGDLVAVRPHFSALVIAASIAANLAAFTPTGAYRKPSGKANLSMFNGIIGKSAKSTWSTRANEEGLTAKGVNECQARLSQSNGFSTSMAIVKAMLEGIRKGGKAEIPAQEIKGKNYPAKTYDFRSKLNFSA